MQRSLVRAAREHDHRRVGVYFAGDPVAVAHGVEQPKRLVLMSEHQLRVMGRE